MAEEEAPAARANSKERAELDAIITGRLVRAVYQPIVELDSGAVIAWEALARGPEGSPLEYPDRLFDVAAQLNRTAELDFVCRAAAVNGAIAAGLGTKQDLFVNVEPSAATADVPAFAEAASLDAAHHLSISIEVTERALTSNPAELLASIALYRQLGWRLALDDVGVDPRSVSLMPFLSPEVIKLDMSFVQQRLTRDRARTVHAVVAEAERSGARVLAEGIENAEHLKVARALGAELGQGWYFGRPGELKATPVVRQGPRVRMPEPYAPTPLEGTPFEVLRLVRPVQMASKSQLHEMSRALENEAAAQGETAVILSTFQDASFFTAKTRRRYEQIAEKAAFVGAFARNLERDCARGVRGHAFDADDAMRNDWTVVVLGPHFAGAFAAHGLSESGQVAAEERFEYAITYDRDLVVEAAARLMQRLVSSAV